MIMYIAVGLNCIQFQKCHKSILYFKKQIYKDILTGYPALAVSQRVSTHSEVNGACCPGNAWMHPCGTTPRSEVLSTHVFS